jgi:type I restriction-modification system DNA methylase subunit
MDYLDEFCKTIKGITGKHTIYAVWSDFLECSAVSLHNSIQKTDELEKQYEEIMSKYTMDEMMQMSKLLGLVVLALEERFRDFLGEVFHRLELHQKFKGQFFTPYPLCRMMAKIAIDEDAKDGKLTLLNDPCVGSGSMIIAYCEELRELGVNYQQSLEVDATDIDKNCYCMAYIQLSLLGVPAILHWANSLSLETWETKKTMFWYSKPFQARKRAHHILKLFKEIDRETPSVVKVEPKEKADCESKPKTGNSIQISLFE